ncbi:MAG: VanZ family protein [Planctomycetes bacterium]|nr:VanZ family protein [Planctomycetota bacterium]
MNTPVHSRDSRPFLFRRGVELLAAAAILFILQTGLIPFDFEWRAGGRGSDYFFGVATSSFTFPDIISNLFLYLPLGAFVHWSLCRLVGRAVVAALLTLVLGAILSGGIEWLQAYSPSRVSSLIDLTCNVLGTAVGIVAGHAMQWIVPRLTTTTLLEFRHRPRNATLLVYCGLLVVVAAMPFSLSLDTGLFKKSLKSADWVPFASVRAYAGGAHSSDHTTSHRAHAYAKWRTMKIGSRWAMETASFALLIWLLYPTLRGYYGFGRANGICMAIWLCALLACLLSLFQLFNITRDFDVTDILFRLVGGGIGLATYESSRRSVEVAPFRSDGRRRAPKVGCILILAYIVYVGVIPLTFSRGGGLTNAVGGEEFWPFLGYFATRFDLMMDDVMEKFGVYAVFAALLVLSRPALQLFSLPRRVVWVAFLGAAISVPLEIVQAYIPVRVTSLTDPILAACGSAAGVLLLAHATNFYYYARSSEFFAKVASEESRRGSRRMSPTDSLIAELMDEKEGAPTEPSLDREPTRPSNPSL